ncbi:hypothetical protein BKA70DRAFT_1366521 [Coprinopsis sp. MPI-PUGE-AT-0042]|nr:hypothetical protein BKA70DRAFT_1366521 [Coprinopsis sp. MPI-PUGE-AT-0042]
MGFGLGLKRLSRSQTVKAHPEDEDPWVIRYKGPVEPPRDPVPRRRIRDSWGDPLEDEEGQFSDEKALRERFKEYGGATSPPRGSFGDDTGAPKGRARAFSALSGRTVSSGAIDPSRNSVSSPRRSTVTSADRPPIPSYVHLDAAGHVGESPAPRIPTKDFGTGNRLSLGSLFSFGSSVRRQTTSARPSEHKRKLSFRKLPSLPSPDKRPSEHGREVEPSKATEQPRQTKSKLPEKSIVEPPTPQVADIAPDDYYNSYYSTLLQNPPKGPEPESNGHSEEKGDSTTQITPTSRDDGEGPSTHPYAYSHSKTPQHDPPMTAPLTGTIRPPAEDELRSPRRLAFIRPSTSKNGLGLKQLRNSTSTPDLRQSVTYRSKFYNPQGIKERWLSAETWCDAILFPRPRLRLKEPASQSLPRIVSPPETPVREKHQESASPDAVPSRVLAHSRSLVNLNRQSPSGRAESATPPAPPPAIVVTPSKARPPRPKSFAADDLALINPAFTLERVLEEGEELETQRKKWQLQAASSLGNSRARDLARSRSKSLTKRGRKTSATQHGPIDYLTARACLGSQSVLANVATPSIRSASTDALPFFFTSHSRSQSLTKTLTKSSKGHSHSDSWSKTVSKHMHLPFNLRPADTKKDTWVYPPNPTTLEGALQRNDTKVIHFPDPALIPIDRPTPGVSPVPSGSGDVHMGVAITTTPVPEDPLDRESLQMYAHPYASAGKYTFSSNAADAQLRNVPTPPMGGAEGTHSKSSSYAPMASHPYARAISPDAGFAIAHTHDDSSVPLQETMWAQVSPGVIREIVPEDLKYSPFMADRRRAEGDETVELGDALTYDRDGRDSGLGSSEGHIIHPYVPSSMPPGGSPRVHREPVRYDVTRPPRPPLARAQTSGSGFVKAVLPSSELLPRTIEHHSPDEPYSGSSSPTPSPRSIGSPHDLEQFRDLFYRPSYTRNQTDSPSPADRPTSSVASITWDLANRGHRTGSGLTSLARQLSEEFEQLEKERRTDSSYSSGSYRSKPMHDGHVRKTTEGGLRFVFEEPTIMSRSSTDQNTSDFDTDQDTTMVITPAFGNIPEDVGSGDLPSVMEKAFEEEDEEEETAVFRLGVVDAISTPPTETAAQRRSFTGLTFSDDSRQSQEVSPTSGGTHLSAGSWLQAPNIMRSSYMTTSTSSRMSGLSDFPVPPKDGHASLLSAFFNDESLNRHQHHGDFHDTLVETPHPFSPNGQTRTFDRSAKADSALIRPTPDNE